jgi:hypothetical protein
VQPRESHDAAAERDDDERVHEALAERTLFGAVDGEGPELARRPERQEPGDVVERVDHRLQTRQQEQQQHPVDLARRQGAHRRPDRHGDEGGDAQVERDGTTVDGVLDGQQHPEDRDERQGERIQAVMARYRLESLARQRAGTMSGGQRQRLALAAATLHEPPLLLLDEPTSAVDPQSRREFWDSLFELVEAGTTILVSTHYMDEAERCHRLAILDRGRLAAEGPPRELMRAVPGAVLEVETAEPLAARRALESLPEMGSVTQLGVRLHAVMEDASPDVAGRVRAHLAAAGVQADVEQVGASLEDVFVAATRRGELRP